MKNSFINVNMYTNKYLGSYAYKWKQSLTLDIYQNYTGTCQEDFYSRFVTPFLREGGREGRVIVIISDAFRYECAKELQRNLDLDEKCDAKMNHMLSVLPSETTLGMASLLPHREIVVQSGLDVVVDDMKCGNSMADRRKILQNSVKRADCYDFDIIKNAKQAEVREMLQDKDVVYIYQNQIDDRGESKKSEQVLSELAYEVGERYFAIQRTEEGYDYSFYDEDFRLMDGGVYENDEISIEEAAEELLEDEGWTGERIRGDYDQLMEKVEEMDEIVMAAIQKSQGEYKPLAKIEELEEANYNMIDNLLNNMSPKKEPYLEYFATECDEFHDMGAYEKSTDVNQIVAVYEKYRENPETAYLGCSMGIIYRDPEDSYYDEAEFAIVKGNTVFGNLMDDVRFYGELALVREGIEKIHEALPDYKFVPMRDVREAMYPEKMTTEQLAEALDEIAEAFDLYEYRDNVEMGENTVQEAMLDLQSGNIHYYISYLKDIVDEECDLSVRAGVLMERLKAYEPELPKDMQPMVYVNYCEESNLMNPRCQKLSELDTKTVEQDKAWYADRDPNTNEPKTTAQMFFTVYYAEKGDKMLHHFQGRIDIGTGNGGIISQLKMQNEMKLADESWISYQQGKGNEEYQKYMEDLTDMQNHVLPYLQSFCSQEEKGVKERREQQVAEKNESREAVPRTGVEANTAVKDAGKAERKAITEKKTMTGKEKKPSIHERLEINKRIIQEKQGKDKPERGADLSVRTV